MEKKITRKEQAKITHDRILEVCRQLLKNFTYDEINISDICEIANVSIGAFYHHFPSKDSIIIEIYRDVDHIFSEEVFPALQNQPSYESVIQFLLTMGDYAEMFGVDFITNIYKAQITHGNEFFLSYQRGLPQSLQKLIEKAVDEHKIRKEVAPETLMKDLLTITRGIVYQWCVCRGKMDLKEEIKRLCSIHLRAFKTENGKESEGE